MDNQHQKIKGYRNLSQEIDLMNEAKAVCEQIDSVIKKVQSHIKGQRDACSNSGTSKFNQNEHDRLEAATPERFTAMAKTEFQTGLMYLVRAIAQPTTF